MPADNRFDVITTWKLNKWGVGIELDCFVIELNRMAHLIGDLCGQLVPLFGVVVGELRNPLDTFDQSDGSG